uniref:Type II secretion system F family protein n=1 Tax=candidate division WOR-3 bacterium TaxID=2052148 RepID=A0A7V3ZUV1_UNCW3
MPLFSYKVRDREGKVLTGTVEGSDVNSVIEKLDALGYIPLSIKEIKQPTGGGFSLENLFAGRVKAIDLINFTRQFVTLHKAGLPMLSAISALQAQTRSKALAKALDGIRKDLMGGASLSQAMAKYPRIFNELYVNSVWAGETGGVLDEILTRLADLLEHERKLRSEVMSALRYPIILMIGMIVAVVVLSTFVLPKFIMLLTGLGTKVPTPTRILITFVNFMKNYWAVGFFFLAILGILFYTFIRTKAGRLWWDRVKLRIPIAGPLIYQMILARFARMFETLDRTGLPILRSLALVSKTVGNTYISQHIDAIAESVRRGRGIAPPMRESGVFPPMVVQMVATGEESGALDEMLRQVADYYDTEVERMAKNLTGLIEPVLILIMGIGVVFIIIAVIMPYMNILTSFGQQGMR